VHVCVCVCILARKRYCATRKPPGRQRPLHARRRIEEGLRIKPDSWEAVGSLAQLEWERAKAKLGYVMPAQ